MTRSIHIDIALIDHETEQVYMEAQEWELEPNDTFVGFALVTTNEDQKKTIKTKEVKN